MIFTAIASGWGRTGYYEDVSESVMKVVIEYFDQPTCEDTYKYSGKLASGSIDWDRMICAGSTNKTGDTCNGDSGGKMLRLGHLKFIKKKLSKFKVSMPWK